MMKVVAATILFVVIGFFGLGYVSNYIGWLKFKKWTNRVGTMDIEESKRRGVFVKELSYKIDSFSGNVNDLKDFKPYLERGFRYGEHTSAETRPLITDYPYQISFSYKPSEKFGVNIKRDELTKFDSSNLSWGYLKKPELPDTVVLNIWGENKSGIIKVW